MNIFLFEDRYSNNFYPLSLTRPVWDLRSGCFSLRERWEMFIGRHRPDAPIGFFTREELVPWYREENPGLRINEWDDARAGETVLCINCAAVPDEAVFAIPPGTVWTRRGQVTAACVDAGLLSGSAGTIDERLGGAQGCTVEENPRIKLLDYIWSLVDENPAMIAGDAEIVRKAAARLISAPPGVTIIGDPGQLIMEEGVRIDPLACVDVTGGPVIVGRGTVIHPFTRVEGPCSVGRDCIILGAKLRAGTTIGDTCRVGGEVEQSIVHGRTNKYHDGFLGHSYVGEWVNLGALTTNSDLKNTYSNVKVNLQGQRIQTEKMKVGCFIGDFTRTSIGTLINTGSSIGVACMLVHGGCMAPRYVPSFSWFMNNQLSEGEPLQATMQTCRAIMGRRGAVMTPAHGAVIERLYGVCEDYRKAEVRKWKDRSK